MTFGGEPLLYADAVCEIMRAATELNIERRQVITNGYFSRSEERIIQVARLLAECGVNDLLLSVDAFHQETIPLDTVRLFAAEIMRQGIPMRMQPAWLVDRTDDNPYNKKTREILESFSELEIALGDGNIIFPEGNALTYLSEYFTDDIPENPYVESPFRVRCASFEPNGNVLGGNVYESGIEKIMKEYSPI